MNAINQNLTYHTKIKDWPESERPREKLLAHGPQILSDAELLAIFIGSGTNGVTALDVAKKLLVENRSLKNMARKNMSELGRMKGIGSARAARIIAAFELARRVETEDASDRRKMTSPQDVVSIYRPQLSHLNYELFKVILLNNGNRLIRDVDISRGTLNSSVVHPREIFKSAIDHMAAGVILMHNHPSGEAVPSEEDNQVTRQIAAAGKLIGIPILDHIIIAGDRFYSYAENNQLGSSK